MKIKSIVIVMLFFTFPNAFKLYAQSTVTHLSETNTIEHQAKFRKVIGADKDAVYVLNIIRVFKSTYYLEKISKKTLERIYIKELDLQFEKGDTWFENAWFIKGNIQIFFHYNVKNKYGLSACSIDKEGNVIQQPKEVFSIEEQQDKYLFYFEIVTGKYIPMIKHPDYNVDYEAFADWAQTNSLIINTSLSSDSTSFFIWTASFSNGKQDPILQVKSIDASFNTLFDEKLSIPFKDYVFDLGKSITSKNGDFFLTSYLKEKAPADMKGKKYLEEKTSDIKIIGVLNKGKELKIYDVSDTAKFFPDANIYIDNNNLCICSIYAETIDKPTGGYLFKKINIANSSVVAKQIFPFDKSFKDEFTGKNKLNQINPAEFRINQFIPDGFGGYYIIAEQTYIHEAKSYNGIDFDLNNIIILQLNADGNLKKHYCIPKNQANKAPLTYAYFLSYYFLIDSHNDLCFFFNDTEKSITQDLYSVSAFSKIDLNGKISLEHLAPADKIEFPLLPHSGFKISPNEILFYFYGAVNSRPYKWGVVKVK